MRSDSISAGRVTLVGTLAVCLALALGTQAWAQSGGTSTTTSPEPTTTTPTSTTPTSFPTVPGRRAKLKKNGKAIPPADAPPNIQNAIIAANQIRKHPYRYGGGHASFYDTGYDCSGAVSYLLYAAGLLESPMPSGAFMTWGEPGFGEWVSVFANKGHMYAVIAGLRWDTSSFGERSRAFRGKGPRWRSTKRKPKGFTIRHVLGY